MEQNSKKYALALGTFDGIHLGHLEVLKKVFQKDYLTACITFSKPPRFYFENINRGLIMSADHKRQTLNLFGFDEVLFLDFLSVKDLSADEFLSVLFEEFPIALISVGYDYRFGKNGEGNVEKLKEYCAEYGAECFVADEVSLDGEAVSSTKIRSFLRDGKIEKANEMLGRNFTLKAEVVEGDKRGRDLGFPTFNQEFPEDTVIPKFGVYKTKVFIDKKAYNAITNVGVRPTFDGQKVLSETYVLSFSGDLYGKEINLEFCSFLRDEIKFSSEKELICQIKKDIETIEK